MTTCSSILLGKCHGQWSLVGCRPLGLRRVGHNWTHTHRHIVLSHSFVSNSLPTRCTVAHQTPLSMETLQARILEWVAMPSSRGSSQSRDWTQIYLIADRFFSEPPGKQLYYLRRSPESSFRTVHYFYTFLCTSKFLKDHQIKILYSGHFFSVVYLSFLFFSIRNTFLMEQKGRGK